MANENLDTTNKLLKPEDISISDNDVIRQLSENLQDISTEDVNAMCDEMDEAEKRKEEEKKKWEISQELKDFRQAWRKKINYLSEDFKNQGRLDEILERLDQIPVKIETDKLDGSRLIEFEVGGKKWKILDPNLKSHSDNDVEYFSDSEYTFITKKNEWAKLKGMRGDDVEDWQNQKLKKYIKEKQREGLYIAKKEDFQGAQDKEGLLPLLGKEIGLDNEKDQIAMLMYLTGINGWYWLGDYNENYRSRYILICDADAFGFDYCYSNFDGASLCMISCE